MKPNAFYEFQISKDHENNIYELTRLNCAPHDDIINNFVQQKFHGLYSNIPYSPVTEYEGYLMDCISRKNPCAFQKFVIYPNEHADIGIVHSTEKTEDANIFWTDHKGHFKVYVFTGLRSRGNELHDLIIRGKLDDELKQIEEEAAR